MKVLMLGWEYPPHITGGLGTACQGLTRSLSKLGIAIDFVVPRLLGDETSPHMQLVESYRGLVISSTKHMEFIEDEENSAFLTDSRNLYSTFGIPAYLAPYWNEEEYLVYRKRIAELKNNLKSSEIPKDILTSNSLKSSASKPKAGFSGGYGGDLFNEIDLYTKNVLELMSCRDFDLIHAHDWITFPAALALARLRKIPLVVHVHSLEFDRCGQGANPKIVKIEGQGIKEALRVIAVSQYTGNLIVDQHSVNSKLVTVVHNGIEEQEPEINTPSVSRVTNGELFESIASKQNCNKMVLFLGRVTYQKGPGYFVDAAARVLKVLPKTTFVVAGTGDLLPKMVSRVLELGISKSFCFTGFLKGKEVEEMFSLASLYVMPSVSEPFGLTALEAIKVGTPVIVSKTSGVSEVLPNAPKVDFWDVKQLASKIIECLTDDNLASEIVTGTKNSLQQLTWDGAAKKVLDVYNHIL